MGVIKGNIDNDFFTENPNLRYLDIFTDLVRSKGRAKASKLSWAMWLMEDVDSPMYKYDKEERKRMVNENYLNEGVKWEEWGEVIEAFVNLTKFSKSELLFKIIMDKFEERTLHLKTVNYDTDWEKGDKMFKETLKIYGVLKAAEKEMMLEKDEERTRGARAESANEQGLLEGD